VNKQR